MSSTTGTQTLSMSYDADGNMTVHGSTVYTFDAENRLRTRGETGGIDVYSYDSRGELTKRANADGSSTVYVDGLYEKDSDGSVTTYYSVLGHRVAMRSAGTLYYLLADHLGSTVAVLDTTGAAVSTQRYWPYGATRAGGATQTDKLYTGQRMESGDAALGLYNYKARFYSTTLGRFVSADDRGSSRYGYANESPTNYTDPSGHCFLSITGRELDRNANAMHTWLECALGLSGCSGALQRFAFIGIGQELFWSNATKFSEFGCSCGGSNTILKVGVLLTMFQAVAISDIVGLDALTSYGWSTIGHWFGVDQPRFFMDSFNTLAYGTHDLRWAGDSEIVGSSEWWAPFNVWNVLYTVDRTFGLHTVKNADLAESDWQIVTKNAAMRLGDNQAW